MLAMGRESSMVVAGARGMLGWVEVVQESRRGEVEATASARGAGDLAPSKTGRTRARGKRSRLGI